MKSSLRQADRPISILFGGDRVKTPFISNMFSIIEEDQLGLPAGELFELPQATRVVVDLTHARYLAADDLIQQLNLYALRGVKLVHLNGGASITQGRIFIEVLEIVKEFFPIRVCALGLKPNLVERLAPHVGGFCVDMKFVPKDSYSDVEVEFYQSRLKVTRPMIDYVLMMKRIIEMVDGMEYTFYTSSMYSEIPRGERSRVHDFLCGRKSPFLIKGLTVVK